MTNAAGCQTYRSERSPRANYAADSRADSTHHASHGWRIIRLGPWLNVGTTTSPSNVMLAVKVVWLFGPKNVASTLPLGVSNNISVGARAWTMNPVSMSSTSAWYFVLIGPSRDIRRSGLAGEGTEIWLPICTCTMPKGIVVD